MRPVSTEDEYSGGGAQKQVDENLAVINVTRRAGFAPFKD
jgi:hypothetical protein